MTLRKKLKAITNNFAWEQDWNIQEYAVHKRDIEYRRGKADAYGDVVHRLDEVIEEFPEESVVKDKMTLRELARELRKIFGFGYLVAYGSELYGYRVRAYLLKPKYIPIGGFWFNETRGNDALLDISFSDLMCDLDLSEYEDEDGNIDYSRCIVEVE